MTGRRVRLPSVALAGVLALVLAGCGSGSAHSGGLSSGERTAATGAMRGLQHSNISFQLVAITRYVQNVPAACRVHLVSRNPDTFGVYVFWIPYLAAEPYVWLTMKVTGDPRTSTFRLGTSEPVLLPGGRLSTNGQAVNPRSVDTGILSRYGEQQDRKNHRTLVAHAADAFTKPGAGCELLANGSLGLLPGG
jgi:hypothetical protein